MKFGAVRLSDVMGVGRLDAPFHLARAQHRPAVDKLIAMGRAKMNEILALIPPTHDAKQAVARGHEINNGGQWWRPGPGYSDLEVAVWIASAIGEASTTLDAERQKHAEKVIEIEAARKKLQELWP